MHAHDYCTLPDFVTARINAYSRIVAIFLKILYCITNKFKSLIHRPTCISFDLFFEENSRELNWHSTCPKTISHALNWPPTTPLLPP